MLVTITNPYTKQSQEVDYPMDFKSERLHFEIHHETPFSEFISEWCVSILRNGDRLYVPCGRNRSNYIYIVTKRFLSHAVRKPYGVYTIPITQFIYECPQLAER